MGVVGLRDFDDWPVSLFRQAVKEFNDFQLERSQEQFELVRLGAFWNAKVWGAKISKPSDLCAFDWEKESKKPIKVKSFTKAKREPKAGKPMSDEDRIKTFGR